MLPESVVGFKHAMPVFISLSVSLFLWLSEIAVLSWSRVAAIAVL
jgi:hypothetical protein